MNVYVVERKSPDVSVRMVEIMGIHKTEAAAKRQREAIWEDHKISTGVTTYMLSDYRFPAPKKVKATPIRKFTR
jgi:threonine dehydratase